MASPLPSTLANQSGNRGSRPRHRWHRFLPGLLILTGLVLGGCDRAETTTRIESVETAANQQVNRTLRGETLVSNQAPVSLRLPRNWRSVPSNALHPTAELQAYNPEQDIYVVVVGEDQANLTASGDLNQQAQIYLQILKGGLDRVIAGETPTSVDTVSGFNAVQYDLRGEVLGTEVAYLHTTVEIEDKYYQVVAWTPNNRFADNFDAMQAIIQAFRPD
jgi:hypothetical protein